MNARSILLPVFVTLAALAAAGPAGEQPAPEFVQQLDLIHFSHTDYGFTDHPAVCRDMQRRYLDIALDAALATQRAPEEARFRWTAETTVAVNDWWQAASPQRRKQFLEAVRAGQIEVTALPLNNTPFLEPRPVAGDDALAARGTVEASSSRRPPCRTT